MNRKVIGVAISAALLGTIATAGLAQNQGGFRGQPGQGGFQRGRRGGFGGFGGFRGQGGFGPFGQNGQSGRGMRGFGGQFGQNDRNPLVTHVFELINRPDVQNNIKLDLRQKNALVQYQQQAQQTMRQQMMQMFQNMRGQQGQGAQPGQTDQPGQTPQRGQRGQRDPAQRQQMREQMQAQRAEIQSKITAGLNEVLKPEQVQRLHELDLQWRGVLSIADPKVAEELQISQEHRTAITNLLNEYQGKSREARQQLFQQFRGNRQGFGNRGQQGLPNGANPPAQQGQQNQANMAATLTELQRKDSAARKEAEQEAIELLSAEERSRWTKAQGQPFTFRTDIQTPRA